MELHGRVKRIRWRSESWLIAVISVGDDEVTAVGPFSHVALGEEVTLTGDWAHHPQYGEQFKVERAESRVPSDHQGRIGFLMKLAHLGRTRAAAMVEHFGDDVFRVIKEETFRLVEIDGITAARASEITATYKTYEGRRDMIVALKESGLTDWQVGKVVERFQDKAVTIATETPYRLLDIRGFGFKVVDAIALKAGVGRESGERIRAAIEHILDESRREGHCFLPGKEVARRLGKLTSIHDMAKVRAAGKHLVERERVVLTPYPDNPKDNAVWLDRMARAETFAAEFVRARRVDPGYLDERYTGAISTDNDRTVDGLLLNDEQWQAVDLACDPDVKLCIITGGPGTGKTTITRQIVDAAPGPLLLCSPTGKAAKRLAEQAQHEAATIHRTLGFNPDTGMWQHDAGNPLEAGTIIVDEMSMVDIELFEGLAHAIATGTKLVLVGDVDQLPSIGPGNVLHDLIRSGRVPVVRLQQVYRQSDDSYISENAKRMRQGKSLYLSACDDFFWHPCDDPEEAFQRVLTLCTTDIPARHPDLNVVRDVHVLAPQRKGTLGIEPLNTALQPLLNPAAPGAEEVKVRGVPFRVGDKVRHIQNNYDLWVMNGEVGIITAIGFDQSGKAKRPDVAVDFGDRVVRYQSNDHLNELVLNFAGTIHSSQGSEYPIVVVICHSYNSFMLNRYLIYTAMTRARDAVYLVGDPRGVDRAVKNVDVGKRFTQLAERIREDAGGAE